MSTKRIAVYLNTGMAKQHELEFKSDAEYVDLVNKCAESLMGTSREILIFTTPFCIYRVQNIVGIEFLDPPPPNDKLPVGFRTRQQ